MSTEFWIAAKSLKSSQFGKFCRSTNVKNVMNLKNKNFTFNCWVYPIRLNQRRISKFWKIARAKFELGRYIQTIGLRKTDRNLQEFIHIFGGLKMGVMPFWNKVYHAYLSRSFWRPFPRTKQIRRVAIGATLLLTTSFLMSEMPAKVDRQFSPSQFNPALQPRIIQPLELILWPKL